MLRSKIKILTITLLTLLGTMSLRAAVETQYSAVVCGSGTYLFGCQQLTKSGSYIDVLGDSTVHLNLLFAMPKATQYSATIEPGQSYLFGCQLLSADADKSDDLESASGCDSTVTVHLSVKAPAPATDVEVEYSALIAPGETYLFGCTPYTVSGAYKNTLPRVGGSGDSIITLHLTVAAVPVAQVAYKAEMKAGETYLFGCKLLTAEGTYKDTLATAAGDSIVTLTLSYASVAPAAQVAYTAEMKAGETYLFGCKLLTAEGTYKDTLATAAGDSIVTLTLQYETEPVIPEVKVQYSTSIELDETYLLGCKAYTFSETGPQILTDTLPAANGGDSIIIVNLQVGAGGGGEGDTTRVKYDATINSGEKYLFGCRILEAAGQYSDTLYAGSGRDSIVTVDLKFAPAPVAVNVAYTATINEGETYLFGCSPLQIAGEYKDTLVSAANADSVVTLTLTVLPVCETTYGSEDAGLQCDSFYWAFADTTIYESGIFVHTGMNLGGCDSIVTLTLVIANSDNVIATPVEECDSYYWVEADTTILTTGTYKHTFANASGCDSVVTLSVTINYSDDVTAQPVEECDSYYWAAADTTILTSGTYVHTFTNGAGCDSVVTLQVTINSSYNITAEPVQACESYYWAEADTTITMDGTYVHSFVSVAGCDSVVTLSVVILQPDATTATPVEECESYYWAEADTTILETGIYQHTFTNLAGCDSVVTLSVTIKNADAIIATPVEECDSYYWAAADTTILTSGTYVHTFTNAAGCDSVVTLSVTINSSYDITADAVEECDSYYWAAADTTILESGTYTHKFASIAGCDSIVTLPVTIYASAASTETPVEECDSYYWASADTTILTSGTYKHVFQTVHGCDSVVTLQVTINNSASTTMPDVDECNKFEWKSADTLITTSGTYTHVFRTVHGCDSVVTVKVTISVPYAATLSLVHKFGNRLLMINRNEINSLWSNFQLDSLDTDHPEYVKWYQIDLAGDTTFVGDGYYYTLESGEPLPTGYTYYAEVNIPASDGNCGAEGKTATYTIPAPAGAPALMPSLARPGEDIKVINLDPEVETTIRIFTAEGSLQNVYTVSGQEIFMIKAAYGQGFYLVEVSADSMKSTLRYIVK